MHGEQNEMARLKTAIIREHEDDEVWLCMWYVKNFNLHSTQDISMEVYNPHNTQAVELYFRGEKMAKVAIGFCVIHFISLLLR